MGATARTTTDVALTDDGGVVVSRAIREASKPLLARFAGRTPGAWLTEEQQEAVLTLLAMHGGQIRPVARLCGISQTVVFDIKHANEAAFTNKRDRWKRAAALESQEVFVEATAQVRAKIEDASARDAAVVAGIFAEKSALFAGDAQVIHHVHSLNPTQMAALAGDAARLRSIAAPVASDPDEVVEADFEVIE